jgi:hypothetical protein
MKRRNNKKRMTEEQLNEHLQVGVDEVVNHFIDDTNEEFFESMYTTLERAGGNLVQCEFGLRILANVLCLLKKGANIRQTPADEAKTTVIN